jgi:hypothetical protein
MKSSAYETKAAQPRKVRVLFLSSDLEDWSPTYDKAEWSAIQKALESGKLKEQFELVGPYHGVDWTAILTQIRDQEPHIVHLCAHGEKGQVILQTPEGEDAPAGSHSFCDLISTLDSPPKCIVLMICQSSSLAAKIAECGVVAIGMKGEIDPRAAVGFVSGFYKYLFDKGRDLRTAWISGRSALPFGVAEIYTETAAQAISFVTSSTILGGQGGEKSLTSASEPAPTRVESPTELGIKREERGTAIVPPVGLKVDPKKDRESRPKPPTQVKPPRVFTKTEEHLKAVKNLALLIQGVTKDVATLSIAESGTRDELLEFCKKVEAEGYEFTHFCEELRAFVIKLGNVADNAGTSLRPVSSLTTPMLVGEFDAGVWGKLESTRMADVLVQGLKQELTGIRKVCDNPPAGEEAQCLKEILVHLKTIKSTQSELESTLQSARNEILAVLHSGVDKLKTDVNDIQKALLGGQVTS